MHTLVLSRLNGLEVSELVCSKKISEFLFKEGCNLNFNINIVDDIRSAVFFALGKTNISRKPVLVVTDSKYASNIYTAMTESLYQHENIIVLILEFGIEEPLESYLRYCSHSVIRIRNKTDIEKIKSTERLTTIIVSSENIDNSGFLIDYENLLIQLNEILLTDDCVACYSDSLPRVSVSYKLKVFPYKYIYGAISKYCGFLQNSNNRTLLLLSDQELMLDQNIFYSKYINPGMKIIVCGTHEGININSWLECNHITCFNGTDGVRQLVESNTPSVCLV